MTFEQAFRRLDEVVGKLEQGDLALEESLALYEEGMSLAILCNGLLDKADLRVRQLVAAPGSDALTAVDFDGWSERDA